MKFALVLQMLQKMYKVKFVMMVQRFQKMYLVKFVVMVPEDVQGKVCGGAAAEVLKDVRDRDFKRRVT